MAVMTSAGSTFALSSAAPATADATGYGALTYTAVGEVTDIGEFGKEFNLVSHNSLGSRQTKKLKGSFNNGSLQLQFGRDLSDAGQIALKNALNSDNSYTFRVTLQNGTKMYFTGKVMSLQTSVGSVDQITGGSATIEIESEITEV